MAGVDAGVRSQIEEYPCNHTPLTSVKGEPASSSSTAVML